MQNDPSPFFKDHVVCVCVMHAKRLHNFFKDHVIHAGVQWNTETPKEPSMHEKSAFKMLNAAEIVKTIKNKKIKNLPFSKCQ